MKVQSLFMPLMFMLLINFCLLGDVDARETYAGIESCKECHEPYYDSYMQTTHAIKSDPRAPAATHACESCHGTGAEHVDSGGGKGVGGIIGLSPEAETSAQEKNAVCIK